jgi:hypothetical protein
MARLVATRRTHASGESQALTDDQRCQARANASLGDVTSVVQVAGQRVGMPDDPGRGTGIELVKALSRRAHLHAPRPIRGPPLPLARHGSIGWLSRLTC